MSSRNTGKAIRQLRKNRSERAGLQFPVGRIDRRIRKASRTKRLSDGAGVYAAAVIEYLAAEILELAGNAARDNKKVLINPRHLTLAIRHDEELTRLAGVNAIFPSGGVIPCINKALLPDPEGAIKKSKKRSKKQAAEQPPVDGTGGSVAELASVAAGINNF